jgi:hypothetical protein
MALPTSSLQGIDVAPVAWGAVPMKSELQFLERPNELLSINARNVG